MTTTKQRYGKLVVSWPHVEQVLAAMQLIARATVQEISFSRLIEPGVDVQRMVDQLVRTGRAVEHREEVGPPTYTTMFTVRKSMVPVDGTSVPSRVLRLIKQEPGMSARNIGLKMGYANPGGSVSAALQRLISSGQVKRVVTQVQHEHYATGKD